MKGLKCSHTRAVLGALVLVSSLPCDATEYSVIHVGSRSEATRKWSSFWADFLTEEVGTTLSPPATFTATSIDSAGELQSHVNISANQFLFAPSPMLACIPALQDTTPLVSLKSQEGLDRLGGVIFARKDSSLTSLGDLRDQVLATESYQSVAYMLGEQLLRRAGVQPTIDLAQIRFFSRAADVVEEVRTGRVDAGCVQAGVLESLAVVEEVKVLHGVSAVGFPYKLSTELLPSLTLVAMPDVDLEVAQRVAAALLGLRSDHPAALQVGGIGFSLSRGWGSARNLVEEMGVLHRDQVGTWRCALEELQPGGRLLCRVDEAYALDGIGVRVLERAAMEESCRARSMACAAAAEECVCRACADVSVARLESLTSLEELGVCGRMKLCGVTEQRRELHMRVVHQWHADAEVTFRVYEGQADGLEVTEGELELAGHAFLTQEEVAVRAAANESRLSVGSSRTGLLIVEIRINSHPIASSPVLVLVQARECSESRRVADERGECVCDEWSLEVTGSCLDTARLLAGTIIAGAALLLLAAVVFVQRQLKAARSYWRIRDTDIKWPEPPEVIGHNENGDVLKAWYLGTEVAVKCVIQKQRRFEGDVNGFAAIIRRRFSVVNSGPATPHHHASPSGYSSPMSPGPSVAARSHWSKSITGKAGMQNQRSMISRGQWANQGEQGSEWGEPRGASSGGEAALRPRPRRASIGGELLGRTQRRLVERRRDSEGGKAEASSDNGSDWELSTRGSSTATDKPQPPRSSESLPLAILKDPSDDGMPRAQSLHELGSSAAAAPPAEPRVKSVAPRIASFKGTATPRSLSLKSAAQSPHAAAAAQADPDQRPSKRRFFLLGADNGHGQGHGGQEAAGVQLAHRSSSRNMQRNASGNWARRPASLRADLDEEGSVRGSRGRRERGARLREFFGGRAGSVVRATSSDGSAVSSLREEEASAGVWASMRKKMGSLFTGRREAEEEEEESDMDDDDLEEEMRVLTRLRHPCITTVMGIIVTRYDTRIVMEYMCYGSLQDLYHNDMIDFTADLLLPILIDVANGMDFLHSSCKPPIIHSDLNAGNVLVDERNRAKVCDFGLSLKRRKWAGSPYWMAPELLMGGVASKKSDVYSFGITLYEVLARAPPYEHEEREAVIKAVADPQENKRPVAPADTPVKLKLLMEEAWQAEAALRPSFKDIKRQLEVIDGELREAHTLQAKERAKLPRPSESDDIVYGMFPRHVAEALLRGEKAPEDRRDCATVFFSDIVAFTTISSTLESYQVSDMLDRLFRRFDDIAAEHGIHKLETIGDCYIGCSNLVENQPDDHVKRMAHFSLAVQQAAAETLIDPDDPSKGTVRIRVGFDSGPVVGNVVGKRYKKYTIFGNTVNTASRMESSGLPGKIQCTKRSADLLLKQDNGFEVEVRGEVEVKGKGKMITYFVNSYNSGGVVASTAAGASQRRGSLDERKRGLNVELGFARSSSVASRSSKRSPKARPASMEVRPHMPSAAAPHRDLDAPRSSAAPESGTKRMLMQRLGAGAEADVDAGPSAASALALPAAPPVLTLPASLLPTPNWAAKTAEEGLVAAELPEEQGHSEVGAHELELILHR